MLVGCCEKDYQTQMLERSVVAPGHDFVHDGQRYQVKSKRPSGRRGSKVTLVGKPTSYDWDYFVWVHYETNYCLSEVWRWAVEEFREKLGNKKRLCPSDIRNGCRLE